MEDWFNKCLIESLIVDGELEIREGAVLIWGRGQVTWFRGGKWE